MAEYKEYNDQVHPAEIHRIDEHLKMSDVRIAACERASSEMAGVSARLTTLIERHDGDIEKQGEKIEKLERRPVTLADKIFITAAATALSSAASLLLDFLVK